MLQVTSEILFDYAMSYRFLISQTNLFVLRGPEQTVVRASWLRIRRIKPSDTIIIRPQSAMCIHATCHHTPAGLCPELADAVANLTAIFVSK